MQSKVKKDNNDIFVFKSKEEKNNNLDEQKKKLTMKIFFLKKEENVFFRQAKISNSTNERKKLTNIFLVLVDHELNFEFSGPFSHLLVSFCQCALKSITVAIKSDIEGCNSQYPFLSLPNQFQ